MIISFITGYCRANVRGVFSIRAKSHHDRADNADIRDLQENGASRCIDAETFRSRRDANLD